MTSGGGASWSLDTAVDLARGGIGTEQAARQQRTAAVVLERLVDRPGLVLADEVGMGKTFVALAVAASVAWRSEAPVVVMVPPRLMDKWERDIVRFRERCISAGGGEGGGRPFRHRRVEGGAELLRCFDDPPDRRCQVVLLANTSLHRAERDPFVRLAAIREALVRSGAGRGLRRAVARFAPQLLWSGRLQGLEEEHFARLLEMPPSGWMVYLSKIGRTLDDDPVPEPFREALSPGDLDRIAAALDSVPLRETKHFDDRVRFARQELNDVLRSVWRAVIARAKIRGPLLVFDEAHHLKNADTRLSSLFQEPETGDTSVVSGAFDRMLFMTATPFQLGHSELLQVLQRFKAVRWESLPEGVTAAAVQAKFDALGKALDYAQREGAHLDRVWGELRVEDIGLEPGRVPGADDWSRWVSAPPPSGRLADVVRQFERTNAALAGAGELLAPWVVRHMRPRTLAGESGPIPRRVSLTGGAILADGLANRGLDIPEDARFPFLLCARAQGLLSRRHERRAYFAEGLASSFGAFLDTSEGGRPVEDADAIADGAEDADVRWYVDSVERFVRSGASRLVHPKVEATVHRAVAHWAEGDKVLVFAHFRKTVVDLRDRLTDVVKASLGQLACKRLGLLPEQVEEAEDRVRRIAERLRDPESPVRKSVESVLERWVASEKGLAPALRGSTVAVLLRNLATPSFVTRNLPIDRPEVRASLEEARPTREKSRSAAEAIAQSLERRRGVLPGYRESVIAFVGHLRDDLCTDQERKAVLDDLLATEIDVVQHADGTVKSDLRTRRLRGFNSPLTPEILVASEVMAEGLDLHLQCRHVIHHDLSWNPSTLEQRTGRVDRLRCRAEEDRQSIRIYLPYMEGTADEKMYRVVTDRERWFQVVMGERYAVDESATERLAARVPFPQAAADALTLDLSV